MSDLISNAEVLETYTEILEGLYEIKNWKCGGDAKMHAVIEAAIKALEAIEELPPAQPEPLAITIDYELSKDECDRLKQAMRDTPIMLLPSAQPDRCDTCRFVYYPKETNNNDQ